MDNAGRLNVILAILAICGTIGGAWVGSILVNQGAIDQWNRQISFDKQGAAEQFSIEIASMNDTLQVYASEYSQNADLECNNADVKIIPNATTLLFVDDPTAPFELVFINQSGNQSITAYQGYPHPQVQNTLVYVVGYSFPNGPHPTFENKCRLYYLILPPTLYNEHGMYYTYVRDVPKFNPNLAQRLDIFYNDITSAESDRSLIQNHLDLINSNILQGLQTNNVQNQYFSAYMDMRMKIINASELEPELLRELNSQIQSNVVEDLTPINPTHTMRTISQTGFISPIPSI